MAETKENVKAEGKSDEGKQGIDLDYVLVNELGQFGRFQLMNILLVAAPSMMHAFMSEYIFSAAAIPHRWHIPFTFCAFKCLQYKKIKKRKKYIKLFFIKIVWKIAYIDRVGFM